MLGGVSIEILEGKFIYVRSVAVGGSLGGSFRPLVGALLVALLLLGSAGLTGAHNAPIHALSGQRSMLDRWTSEPSSALSGAEASLASCHVPDLLRSAVCSATPLPHSSGAGAPNASNRSPPPRFGASMAYDAADGYVVLFGGWNATRTFGDTWTYSAGNWTRLFPTNHPAPRVYASMTYDAKDGYILLFGGGDYNSPNNYWSLWSDTWKFVGGQWTMLTPSSSPSYRMAAGLTYDVADQYAVMFGGAYFQYGGTYSYNDTWKFSQGNWTQVNVARHPSSRAGEGLAFDGKDGYVVLFGGSAYGFAAATLHDTWKFLGGHWTRLANISAPSSRAEIVMTYDAADGYILLYGGATSTGSLGSTWSFSNGTWVRLANITSPPPRAYPASTYDTADGYVLVFSGVHWPGYSPISGVWAYATGSWTKL